MAFGLQFKGTHGIVQIDQGYTNMALVKKATIDIALATGSNYNYPVQGGGNAAYGTAYNNYDTGLAYGPYSIAIRANAPILIERSENINGNLNVRLIARGSPVYGAEIYLFAPADRAPAPTGNWGVKIFDNSGTVRYDSRLNYLKILGSVSRNWSAGAGTGVHGTFASTKVAFMPAQQALQWVRTPAGSRNPGGYTLEMCGGYIASGGQYDGQFLTQPIATAQGQSGQTPDGQNMYSNYPESAVFYMVDVAGM